MLPEYNFLSQTLNYLAQRTLGALDHSYMNSYKKGEMEVMHQVNIIISLWVSTLKAYGQSDRQGSIMGSKQIPDGTSHRLHRSNSGHTPQPNYRNALSLNMWRD